MVQTRPLSFVYVLFLQNDKFSTNLTLSRKAQMVVLGFEARTAAWQTQTNPQSYGGPRVILFTLLFLNCFAFLLVSLSYFKWAHNCKKCDLACPCCRKEFLHGLLNLETNILEFWLGTLHNLFLNGPFRASFSSFYSKQINVRY